MSVFSVTKLIAYGVIPVVLALAGDHFAAEVVTSRRKRWMYRALFWVLGLLCVILIAGIEKNVDDEHEREVSEGQARQQTLESEIKTLQSWEQLLDNDLHESERKRDAGLDSILESMKQVPETAAAQRKQLLDVLGSLVQDKGQPRPPQRIIGDDTRRELLALSFGLLQFSTQREDALKAALDQSRKNGERPQSGVYRERILERETQSQFNGNYYPQISKVLDPIAQRLGLDGGGAPAEGLDKFPEFRKARDLCAQWPAEQVESGGYITDLRACASQLEKLALNLP